MPHDLQIAGTELQTRARPEDVLSTLRCASLFPCVVQLCTPGMPSHPPYILKPNLTQVSTNHIPSPKPEPSLKNRAQQDHFTSSPTSRNSSLASRTMPHPAQQSHTQITVSDKSYGQDTCNHCEDLVLTRLPTIIYTMGKTWIKPHPPLIVVVCFSPGYTDALTVPSCSTWKWYTVAIPRYSVL